MKSYKNNLKSLVFDIEGNGLLNIIDTVWCICAKDLTTKDKIECRLLSKEEYKQWLYDNFNDADELIGHGIIYFDLPVLEKLFNWRPNENTKIIDTLVMSRLANPDRPKPSRYTGKAGPHSLDAWGCRAGKSKLFNEEWGSFSSNILRRCRQDVEINEFVYYTVSNELKSFSQESVELEHTIAKIITKQELYGIRFDLYRAKEYVNQLQSIIDDIDKEVVPKLPKGCEAIGRPVTAPFTKVGKYKQNVVKYYTDESGEVCDEDLNNVAGPFSKIRFFDFPVNSSEKIKLYLLDNGWKPEKWNFSKLKNERTSPKLEGDFEGVEGDIPNKIKKRITIRHRKSQIEGWIKNCNKINDNLYTLPAGANSCGTPTGRMKHNTVVNIPKANTNKETGELEWDINKQEVVFGTQMRSLFIPRDGYVLVGHDAKGLELRMLAHYMNDPAFTYELLNGDPHSFNQMKAGLETRAQAKTFIYALIYGAGDAKIGSIVGGDAKIGKEIIQRYFSELPSLGTFIEKVKRSSGRGTLKGLDGRILHIRKDDNGRIKRSTAPNTLLQSAGAIVMKKSCELLWDWIKSSDIKAYKVLDMHDEGQSEVLNDVNHIEPYCKFAVNSVIKAGEYFNLNIPLDADYKIGANMAETH